MIDEEFIEGRDYVKCELCGECMKQLQNHILKTHGITVARYRELFPEAKISSDASTQAKAEANRKKYRHVENHHYQKRFVYLLPDGTYASKSDKYKRAWGVDEVNPEHIVNTQDVGYIPTTEMHGVEGEDYVVCRICGEKKGSLTQHLRKKHGMTVDEYRSVYLDASVHSKRNEEAFHQCAVNKWKTQRSK